MDINKESHDLEIENYLADVREKSTPIKLDKPRHIMFDLNAFGDLEEEFGDITKAFEALQGGSVNTIKKLLWMGLKHEDEFLTERQVGSLITFNRLTEIMELVGVAMGEGLPKNEESPV